MWVCFWAWDQVEALPFVVLGGMEREKAGVGVGREVAGHSLWGQERLWTKNPGGQVASLS